MIAILTRPHRPLKELAPQVDPELLALIEGCLMKDREERVQSAREVSERLTVIARQLAGQQGLDEAPQRRATDRLPRPSAETVRKGFTLGAEELRTLSKLRMNKTAIGALCALTGIAIGASAAYVAAAARGDVQRPPAVAVALPEPPAMRAESVTKVQSLGSLPIATASKPVKGPGDPSDLAVAVARGLRVSDKSRH